MSLSDFAQTYTEFSASEQQTFADAVRRLLSDGIIWREHDQDRPIYNILVRRREMFVDYLAVAGWELRYDERLAIFHVIHRDGAHRRQLTRDTTIWLLLLRLIYAEKYERVEVSLTRYPTISIGDLYNRYTEFFPGQAVKKKTSLSDALRALQGLKLIRAGGGGALNPNNNDQLIELLPTLEIVVSGNAISEIADQIQTYAHTTQRSATNHTNQSEDTSHAESDNEDT